MTLAQEAGLPVEEGRYQWPPSQADECFLTNTTMEIMPVTRIGATPSVLACRAP